MLHVSFLFSFYYAALTTQIAPVEVGIMMNHVGELSMTQWDGLSLDNPKQGQLVFPGEIFETKSNGVMRLFLLKQIIASLGSDSKFEIVNINDVSSPVKLLVKLSSGTLRLQTKDNPDLSFQLLLQTPHTELVLSSADVVVHVGEDKTVVDNLAHGIQVKNNQTTKEMLLPAFELETLETMIIYPKQDAPIRQKIDKKRLKELSTLFIFDITPAEKIRASFESELPHLVAPKNGAIRFLGVQDTLGERQRIVPPLTQLPLGVTNK